MRKPLSVVILGYGLRGRDYSRYALLHPDEMRIAAIAEPDAVRRGDGMERFGLASAQAYISAEALLAQPRMAEVAFVTTQDRQHVPVALAALQKGYDLLVEKPVSPDLRECLRLEQAAARHGRRVTVCHVMRYTLFYQEIKRAILRGEIGDVQSVAAVENVGYFHQAHSFVRGNWRRSDESSPMILAKCCHDLDLLLWLVDQPCERVSSFGSLSYFRAERAPAGAAARCLDGCRCKDGCPYDAEKIYVTNYPTGIRSNAWKWPCSAITEHPTEESVYAALREGPYGRCVFHCDNDAVDHQVVNLSFAGHATASLTMCAFTNSDARTIKVMGTLGDIVGDLDTNRITVQAFGQAPRLIDLNEQGETDGHAGGDMRMIGELVRDYSQPDRTTLTALGASIDSHVAALAAEYSRLHDGASVSLAAMRSEARA